MAKIIHSQSRAPTNRVRLPLEKTVKSSGSKKGLTEGQSVNAESSSTQTTSQLNANEKRLRTERDLALAKVADLEKKIGELTAGLHDLEERAAKQGYQNGLEKAAKENIALLQEEGRKIDDVLENLLDQQSQLLRLSEESAVEIGMSAAFKLLGRTSVDHALFESLVEQSLNQVLHRDGIVIYLSPGDCERMRSSVERSQKDWSGISFEADKRIKLGGCRIESKAGRLDARLELQIAELKRVLMAANVKRQQ